MSHLELPPGLKYDGPLVETANDGQPGQQWIEYKKVKMYTNAFVIMNDTKVLLGLKKRGFGMGLWNGFGGKVDPGETSLEAAVRELEEEAGIKAPLVQCGTLFFVLEGTEAAFDIDVFRAYEYNGTVTESDEMRPQWHSIQEDLLPKQKRTMAIPATGEDEQLPTIPLEQMWQDDRFWMPHMFARRYFVGRADFSADNNDNNKMVKWWFAATPEADV